MHDLAEPNRLQVFIGRLARRTAGLHWSSHLDADDLAQEGQVALLNAERSWNPDKGDFGQYARTVIRREMRAAALRGDGDVSGGLRAKRKAIRARIMERQGVPAEEIATAIGVESKDLPALLVLATPASREEVE